MAKFFRVSKKNQALGQVLTANIERLDLNGCGIARVNKKPIFIAGTLPSETVKIKVFEQKNKYSRATLVEIIKASDERIPAKCLHYKTCGGCDLQHLHPDKHIDFKQQKVSELFARNQYKGDLLWQLPITDNVWHYRRKARIGVQYDKKGQVTLGFRQKSTNQLVKVERCLVLVEPLTSIFTPLKLLLQSLTLSKSVGHIEVIASEIKEKVTTDIITLVIRQLKPLNSVDKALWQEYALKYHWQVLIDNGENITPITENKPLSFDLLDDITLTFTVNDFIQINHKVNQKMVEQAMHWLALKPNDVVLDLFCGLGNFSLPIAKKVKKVVGIEGVTAMVEKAVKNADNNQLTNCQFYQADLNSLWLDKPWVDQDFNKVLLDPARAGALEAVEQIITLSIDNILYVSCDPATLARDAEYLINNGYHIEKSGIIDMFPQTKHVETMVLFSR